jgi:glycosyltransferase involved in cell wall biosynthesis
MMKQFKIIVPSFNSVDYIEKTLSSIEMQSWKDYAVCVIDDASTLKKQREIILAFCKKNQWPYRFHEKNYGALYGMVHVLKEDLTCDDDDVIVVLDGDDWLANDSALETLHKVYVENDVYLTWGQCERYPAGNPPMKYAQAIPEMVIKQKLFRNIPFVFWHLATFKYYLWRNIRDEDLRDINGEYFRYYKDKATLYPMLEMAGDKIKFISETLAIYNLENPLNDYRTAPPEEFERVNKLIQNKPKYETLDFNSNL